MTPNPSVPVSLLSDLRALTERWRATHTLASTSPAEGGPLHHSRSVVLPRAAADLDAVLDRWARAPAGEPRRFVCDQDPHPAEIPCSRCEPDGRREVAETVEYRVTTNPPDGDPVTFDARDFQAQFWVENHGRFGYPSAVVECRTATTVTTRTAWRPVDAGADTAKEARDA